MECTISFGWFVACSNAWGKNPCSVQESLHIINQHIKHKSSPSVDIYTQVSKHTVSTKYIHVLQKEAFYCAQKQLGPSIIRACCTSWQDEPRYSLQNRWLVLKASQMSLSYPLFPDENLVFFMVLTNPLPTKITGYWSNLRLLNLGQDIQNTTIPRTVIKFLFDCSPDLHTRNGIVTFQVNCIDYSSVRPQTCFGRNICLDRCVVICAKSIECKQWKMLMTAIVG